MKVVFDLSPLGHSYRNPMGQTGIYRTVLRLAHELAAVEELDLRWSSFAFLNHRRTAKVIKNTPLSSRPLINYGSLFEILGCCEDGIRAMDRSTAGRVFGLRFAAATLEKWERGIEHKRLSAQIDTDIWHSTSSVHPQIVTRSPFVRFYTVYDLMPLKYPDFFRGVGDQVVAKLVQSIRKEDWVICISEATKSDLLEERPDLDPNHLRVAYLAASAELAPINDAALHAQLLQRLGMPVDAPYFLSVCTLQPRKNLDSIVKAFQQIAAHDKDCYLILVGNPGWDNGPLRQLLDSDSTGRIKITGFIPDEELALLYSGCLAFVFVSHYEGFGLPLLEAMQCGAPVVCSDNSSLPEVVGNAAIMINSRNVDQLIDALQTIRQDSNLRQQLRTQGFLQAKQFSWKLTALKIVEAYRASLA